VRPFQDVLIELGARLGLPAFVREDGSPRYKDYPDYITNHERMPGVGPLAGFRGADGYEEGRGRAEPGPAQAATWRTAASGATTCRRSRASSSTPTRPTWSSPRPWG
jgi:hypothetical protein